MEYLSGGRADIFRKDNKVLRPVKKWTPDVHKFLLYMAEKVDFLPVPYELTENQEVVSFIEGDVYHYPLPDNVKSDHAVESIALLLRKYHDASKGYLSHLSGNEEWMLLPKEPFDVMCHGDLAPYNMVMSDAVARGIFDFDTLHPGPIIWDVAYAAYRWIICEQIDDGIAVHSRKLKLFFDAYQLAREDREIFVAVLIERIEYLMIYMVEQADEGETQFLEDIENDHIASYKRDINYLRQNQSQLIRGIL